MASVLGFVSAGASLVAVGVVGHWSTRRRDSLGRSRPFPVWSVSLLTVLAVTALVPVARHRIEERRLTRVASALVGHPVKVHCQSTTAALVDAGAELGFVPYDADGVPLPRTTIKRDPCRALSSYLGGDRGSPSYDEVVAVHVLTHEAMHMRGQTSEALAECEAVQRDATTAALLGATPAQARALAVRYWQSVYPQMPDDYSSGDCRPGGSLDEHLASAPWS
jgi:sirohydrochlorin ferrochelatase